MYREELDEMKESIERKEYLLQFNEQKYYYYEKVLRDVIRSMGIAELEVVPHTCRHTWPSNDVYHERRSLQAVGKRGCWAHQICSALH